MNQDSPVIAYERACRRYLDLQAIQDFEESTRQQRQLQLEFAEAFAGLEEIRESPDPAVWHALGDAYSKGWGTTVDKTKAREWFRKAAEAGHTQAMVRLGMLLDRPAPEDDPAEAVLWFRRAAELGNASGMISLGFAYREGRGVSQDPSEAVRWFIKAVETGDGHSMIHVGRMYSRWLEDPVKAVEWFNRAAEEGFTESHIELAELHDVRGSPIYSQAEAVKWYLRVAEGTSASRARAMLALARHYRDGDGVERSSETALQWLDRLLLVEPETSAIHREAVALIQNIKESLL